MARPRNTKEPEMLIATDSGCVEIDGVPYFFHKDKTRVRSDHALAKASPGSFKPLRAHYPPEAEQATAAPGERRGETA